MTIFFKQCVYTKADFPNGKKRRGKNSKRRDKKPQTVDYLKVECMVSDQIELFTGLHIYFSIQHEKILTQSEIFSFFVVIVNFCGGGNIYFFNFFGRARNFPCQLYYILLPCFFLFVFFFFLSASVFIYNNITTFD